MESDLINAFQSPKVGMYDHRFGAQSHAKQNSHTRAGDVDVSALSDHMRCTVRTKTNTELVMWNRSQQRLQARPVRGCYFRMARYKPLV